MYLLQSSITLKIDYIPPKILRRLPDGPLKFTLTPAFLGTIDANGKIVQTKFLCKIPGEKSHSQPH